ncbi:MAG: preprotein translocase subunit SecA [Patescibacteria group bacterium]|nr:preprotein translocase subunit SecA [Patescibacteria group bacterium]
MFKFLGKILDTNQREIKKLKLLVERINELESKYKKIKKSDFKKITLDFKKRLKNGEKLDDLMIEAFALAREAALRTIGLRLYDEQLMAAICFHQGKVAEQKTGEGKTLSAVPALYLNALSEKGCHLVTVNDYLSKRDAGWNGVIFDLLGVSVGVIVHEKGFVFDPKYKNNKVDDPRLIHLKEGNHYEAYRADITYGTNNEFGFDYLRDNMVQKLSQMTQRGHNFCIVDEVDSILIDEARTPLIISAPDTEPTDKYMQFSLLVNSLSRDTDFESDEKHKTVNLTEHGIKKIEKKLGIDNLYEKDFDTIHHLEQALKAREHFHKDRDYVIKENEIIIVDEFTGRLMFGRRYSEGLHQAIEAKESVTIKQESKTLATISFQNYFRMYKTLAGMTGTAATEAEEFKKIYNLETVVIPTHKPLIRKDASDMVFKTTRAKYGAIVKEVEERHKKGQPILIGTTSISKNQIIDKFLKRKKIPHQVLNAKNHLKEASIISQAGAIGAVTVATNMAGRGVDIVLGGDPNELSKKKWQKQHDKVLEVGGLHVIGIERHESRRIDNQLRGRAGRQGDSGSSRFYVSLEDDIMRIFGGEQISKLMTTLKMPEDVPLEHAMVTKAIEQAQIKVEGFHFDSRKHLVEYDDVMNKQREIIYRKRRQVLDVAEQDKSKEKLKDKLLQILTKELDLIAGNGVNPETGEVDSKKIVTDFNLIVPFDPRSQKRLKEQVKKLSTDKEISNLLFKTIEGVYKQRESQTGEGLMREMEKFVMLSTIDNLWINHLDAIDDLREGIGLRGYAQRDPLVEYKAEAFSSFEQLMGTIDYEIARRIFRVQITQRTQPQAREIKEEAPAMQADKKSAFAKAFAGAGQSPGPAKTVFAGKKRKKIGRNDPCWCGSGKKWKKCCYPNKG